MRNLSLNNILPQLSGQDNFVLLDTSLIGKDNKKSYLFKNPLEVVSCYDPLRVRQSFKRIDSFIKRGYFAAGFVSYEAGFALEEAFKAKKTRDFPLIWFGIFKEPEIYNTLQADAGSALYKTYNTGKPRPDISKREYISRVNRIKKFIERGDTYQINYTFRLNFPFSGSAENLYLRLREKQKVPYSALIKFKNRYILSFSPELFFKKQGNLMKVMPMKGTMERGRLSKEDSENAKKLHQCPKNRSENIMIVDLLRNDLGRLSLKGAVKTKSFFDVEKYNTLFQMTSTVEARTRPELSMHDIFKAIFPSGSVTGAPKISSMRIIDTLEKSPRGIYTGGIGFLSPEREAVFNVAIRTLFLEPANKKGQMGIGSGIVYDSVPEKEYDECVLKARFLTEKEKPFSLIETILWKSGKGYPFFKFHLKRLSESADYFGFTYSRERVVSYLSKLSKRFNNKEDFRIRLLLNKDGSIDASYSVIQKEASAKDITLSSKRTDSRDRFLFHKTTNRSIYDREYSSCRKKGFFDIIFRNEKEEITEGAISNLFIKKNNTYYTPPLGCGLLNGVYRRHLMSKKGFSVKEKVLTVDDIKKADKIILTNAVRGMVNVRLKDN